MKNKILSRKKLNPSEAVFTGVKLEEHVSLQLFKYNADTYYEDSSYSEASLEGIPNDDNRYWLNIHGIHDVERIQNICNKLGIHQLAVQDILDINQRPKFQEYEKYWFFSIKSILPSDGEMQLEQLSFILGENYLVSFQEKKADYFYHIRQRIREDIGIVRQRGADYLLYLLFESILDNYIKTIDKIEVKSENLGLLDISSDPSPNTLKMIDTYKRQIHQIRKNIVPMKEFISKIEREKLGLISENHFKYFYDIKDLCLALIDDCEQIEMKLESNVNLFFSIQGHRMNQVMKTLTVVATIFIPLTFIAGIYGMNFNYMPELNWKWGYFGVWLIIFIIFGGMLLYFKNKKWF
ncbi:MAG: magnesium/cobalt transporter CorA [Flavobacteriaceae bacterium]|nr:magnesium/cobalt transporter CorA [Flavobacteriaceae bacterium]